MKRKMLVIPMVLLAAGLMGCATNAEDKPDVEDTSNVESASNIEDTSNAEGGSNAEEKPYEGTKIVVGCEAGGAFTEFYKSAAPEFTEQTGIDVEFFEIAHANTHDRFLTEALAGTGSIDVYQLDQPWVSEFASLGYLEPVSEEMKAQVDDFDDFSESGLATMSYDGVLYGLPFQYHTPILFYRSDIFEEAGLEPPTTWDEYREIAKTLTNKEEGFYGTCLEGAAVLEPVTHFLDKILQAGGNYWDEETGEVTFDSEAARDALSWMYAIQNEDQSSPEGALGYENGDVYNLFLEGRLAMVSEWPYFYAGAQDPEQSTIVGKVKVAPQPMNVENTSGLWAFGHGVIAASKNKEAAWLFCVWSTSKDILTRFSISQTTPNVRASSMEAVLESSEVPDDIKEVLRVINDACLRAKPVTNTEHFPAVQERLSLTLSNVLSGSTTIEDEVAATQAELEEIFSD